MTTTPPDAEHRSPVDTLADELFDAILDAEPMAATLYGIPGRDDRLADYSQAGERAVAARVSALLERTEALDADAMTDQERITRAVILQQGRVILERVGIGAVEYTVTSYFSSAAVEVLYLMPRVAITDDTRAAGYLHRLAALPGYLATIAERHRNGIAAGRVPVAYQVEAAVDHLDRYLADPEADPLRKPEPPDGPGADAFRAERDHLLDQLVRPAFAAYRDVLRDEIAMHGRPSDRPGLCYLPGGDDTYALLAKANTTTDRSPQELHDTGLAVIAGLAEEYREIGIRVFGTSDLAEIFERLRTDPALRWDDADELLDAARAAIRRAEDEAPAWFGVVPDHQCVVEAVPASEAPGAPTAYYMPAALDGSRPGTYFANTHRAEERNRSISESIAFHEAVPGHHFQISIAQQLTSLPMLRRMAGVTAYLEGWGLYTERLADEMGLYSGDIARLGMLTVDSMRAGRLVVDTGLHALGWSRQQAVDYLLANTPMARVEIDGEVDRYVADPGQALAYMVGRLEIQRMRAEAEQRLGADFDIRAFHDLVLSGGPLPLSVLADVVRTWRP